MQPPAEVVEYDPAWPAAFAAIRRSLAPHLPAGAVVEHVGSTAVPGLAAKPIVDVDVVVPSAQDVAAAVAALVGLGYDHRGDLGIAGREAFGMPRGSGLAFHHLYVVVAGLARAPGPRRPARPPARAPRRRGALRRGEAAARGVARDGPGGVRRGEGVARHRAARQGAVVGEGSSGA